MKSEIFRFWCLINQIKFKNIEKKFLNDFLLYKFEVLINIILQLLPQFTDKNMLQKLKKKTEGHKYANIDYLTTRVKYLIFYKLQWCTYFIYRKLFFLFSLCKIFNKYVYISTYLLDHFMCILYILVNNTHIYIIQPTLHVSNVSLRCPKLE